MGELSVGQYEVHVETPGFSLYTNNSIGISIGRVAQLTVRLVPADVQEQVTVSEQASSIDASASRLRFTDDGLYARPSVPQSRHSG